jgi:hypothetical protein
MKIKVYIVTYKGHKRLLPTLTSLFESDLTDHEFEVNIINNHTDIRVPSQFFRHPELNIIHNNLRPDFSSGHLSRNWNQALVNGFKSLTHPNCDIVVCSQDDSIFRKQWASRLNFLMGGHPNGQYTFVQGGHGDQFHAYKPEAVRKVGLWDERFCGISRQAADYFYRCLIYNPGNSCIQDTVHKRVLNPVCGNDKFSETEEDLKWAQNYLVSADVRAIDSVWDNQLHGNEQIASKLMLEKWGCDPFPWNEALFQQAAFTARTICSNYITYPYFEKDVYDLEGKGYIV